MDEQKILKVYSEMMDWQSQRIHFGGIEQFNFGELTSIAAAIDVKTAYGCDTTLDKTLELIEIYARGMAEEAEDEE